MLPLSPSITVSLAPLTSVVTDGVPAAPVDYPRDGEHERDASQPCRSLLELVDGRVVAVVPHLLHPAQRE